MEPLDLLDGLVELLKVRWLHPGDDRHAALAPEREARGAASVLGSLVRRGVLPARQGGDDGAEHPGPAAEQLSERCG